METKEPLKQRLKKDIAMFVLILLVSGGAMASFLARSPYTPYLIGGLFLLTFGPYVVEYAQEKLTRSKSNNPVNGKLVVTGIIDEEGNKTISIKRKGGK